MPSTNYIELPQCPFCGELPSIEYGRQTCRTRNYTIEGTPFTETQWNKRSE